MQALSQPDERSDKDEKIREGTEYYGIGVVRGRRGRVDVVGGRRLWVRGHLSLNATTSFDDAWAFDFLGWSGLRAGRWIRSRGNGAPRPMGSVGLFSPGGIGQCPKPSIATVHVIRADIRLTLDSTVRAVPAQQP
ncbi:hypothetical protein CPLU01_13943 [Colletotrichum plurivorum]|uniref:Uncharacterized protein n=1 Tax=Colletotrichum plurivorum TaxID=2175906 RepID=A0A8H6JNM4_9PEZI|nr:hypothetical protein CPLU01_13943 [Colletotrichum plurivorum]